MLHKALQASSSVQACLSRVAASEACGQSSKTQKSFAHACQKTGEAFCLSSLLPSPLVRGAITVTLFLGQERKRDRGKKPKSSIRRRGRRPDSIHETYAVFSESRNYPEGRTRNKHIFVSDADHLKDQVFPTF